MRMSRVSTTTPSSARRCSTTCAARPASHRAGAGRAPRSRASSQAQRGQPGVVVRAAAERPVELAIPLVDPDVVDAGLAAAHQAVVIELPLLVAVGPEPGAGRVVRLVDEAEGDPRAGERPDFFDQAVVELGL